MNLKEEIIINDPSSSSWLKQSIERISNNNIKTALNETEILLALLRQRSKLQNKQVNPIN